MRVSPRLPVGDVTLLDLLRRARAQVAATGRPVLATYIEPLPGVLPLDAFRRAEGMDDRIYWARPDVGMAAVGIGAAVTIAPSGAGRFAAVSGIWNRLVAEGICVGPAALDDESGRTGQLASASFGRRPMLLGGFRFDTLRAPDPAWLGFADAWLVVPRLCLARSPEGSWLATNALVKAGDDPVRLAAGLERDRDRIIGALPSTGSAQLWKAIAAGLAGRPAIPLEDVMADATAPVARGAFMEAVASGAAAVRAGELEKVVIARAESRELGAPPDIAAVLGRLTDRYPACHILAVARGRRVFLGASPERLVQVQGRMVSVTGLAGSIARGATPEADVRQGEELLRSAKDREEHAIVVRALVAGLDGLCDDLDVPAQPVLLTIPDVHHLYSPVTARLRDGVGLLDLVERLHPTPAVGGAPRERALEFIREHEAWDRGWYAAPVGWLDAAGDGEMAVALRSALVDGDRATLFAGCGVMGDSDPALELAESELKTRAMAEALTFGVRAEEALDRAMESR